MKPLSCDVLVVGSGAGGGTVAYALARAGVKVLLVDKGPYHATTDFRRDELAVCRRDYFVPYVSDEPILMRKGIAQKFAPGNQGWTACCVGGGTVHMSGFFYRLHPVDFELRTRLGAVEGAEVWDWPIGYEDLAPYYDRVEALLGVGGRAGENPHAPARRHPYVLPPLDEHPMARAVDQHARALGMHPFSTPRAVLSRAYDGRPRCTYSGLCGSYGCETSAKSSALVTVIPKAVATGRCRVLAGRMVARLLSGPDGRVRGAELRDREGGSQKVLARAVCVAAGAIQSARLLLNSTSAQHPRGLANGNGRVGQHLFFSTFGHVEAEFLREGAGAAIAGFDSSLPWLGRSVQDSYMLDGGQKKGGTLRFDFVHPNPIYNAEHVAVRGGRLLWGADLKRALRRRFRQGKTLESEIFAEFLPGAGSRVEVDDRRKDRFGVPVPRVTLRHHPRDAEICATLVERSKELFTSMGADRIEVLAQGETTYVLQGGTACFGSDPALHVLDPNCRAHEVDNLYVVDGSFMPSSGGVPITLTIQANALRVGERLAARFGRREI